MMFSAETTAENIKTRAVRHGLLRVKVSAIDLKALFLLRTMEVKSRLRLPFKKVDEKIVGELWCQL